MLSVIGMVRFEAWNDIRIGAVTKHSLAYQEEVKSTLNFKCLSLSPGKPFAIRGFNILQISLNSRSSIASCTTFRAF